MLNKIITSLYRLYLFDHSFGLRCRVMHAAVGNGEGHWSPRFVERLLEARRTAFRKTQVRTESAECKAYHRRWPLLAHAGAIQCVSVGLTLSRARSCTRGTFRSCAH